ncbi:phosphatidylserine decarboxylase family protein [Fundidesulfovibrio terrae]|uniref:phosphatidylserine decarboxylase family protein n=1 Tax=Fundidesulfovibrio terrae TaxID=2922866 RepID=UPI001FAEDD4C|nr:phosphatidylserine decarboxylase family protein [Fundidesulfovibrio terrae]
MRKPYVSLTPEGWPSIILAGSATLVFSLLNWAIPAVLGLVVLALLLNFFRDPERFTPVEPGLAVAPADGKVIKVARAVDPMTGEERVVVCIFMNVFNVHVNRACVAGAVSAMRYWAGKFINASFDKASEHNERLAVQLTDEDGKTWTMVQIAGLVARRIIPWAEMGDRLERGQRYGMIKFGSRVDVYLPEGWTPAVNVGQRTAAAQTVIARKE